MNTFSNEMRSIMSGEDARQKLRELQQSPAVFDYAKTERYVALVKEFLRRSASYCRAVDRKQGFPFVEVEGLLDLPTDLEHDLLALASVKGWPPTSLRACQQHLRYVMSRDQIAEANRDLFNIYEPLFISLTEGGDFYAHHGGEICIQAAATVFTSCYR